MGDPQLPHGEPVSGAAPGAADLGEEVRLGGSEAGRAANAALLALSRTARSFTLYDARNQAVHEFLGDLRAKVAKVLELSGGPLELEVRPFELALHGEVVYLERERERSLAFRLFRDGVRSLSLLPGLDWDDLLGLVEILSLRYSGVRQQEDDIVTLFSKANFAHLRFTAIEGFRAEEELHETDAPADVVGHVAPPADWDLPLPALPPAAGLHYRPLDAAVLERLRGEHGETSAAREALDLVLELLERVNDQLDELDEEHVEGLVFEVRDFLLAEGRYPELLELVAALGHSAAGDLRPRPSILARFGGAEPLRHLVRREQRQAQEPPEQAFTYLRSVPGNPLADLIDMLAAEQEEAQRPALRALVAGLAGDRPRLILERLEQADARLASDLLGALQRALPELAVDAALKLKDRSEPALQLAAARTLGAASFTPAIGRALVQSLSSKLPEVRSAALESLAAFRDPRVQEALVKHAQERSGKGMTDEEAELVGEALARQDPAAAFSLFSDWLHPRTMLQRVVESPGQRRLHRVAVAGLARLPGEEPEKVMRWFLGKCTGDLHQFCLAALVQRRREQQRARAEGGHAG